MSLSGAPSSMPPSGASNSSVPPSVPPPIQRVAVVVNGNAKSVTEEVISTLDQILLGGDLFVSRTLREGEDIAKTIVDRGYGTVLTGGGDGTFTITVTQVVTEARRKKRPLPRFGFLKLGTGNALAHVVGASGAKGRGLAADIQRLLTDAGSREVGLVEVDGLMAPFCGFGADAFMLQDYSQMKSWIGKTPLRRYAAGPLGYILAATTRAIPRQVIRAPLECRIENVGKDCVQIGPKGSVIGSPIRRGELVYQGPARLVGLSTIPYYGFGFRAFPYAEERPDRMHLRVSTMSARQFVGHFREVWRGEYADPAVTSDFLVQDVKIKVCPPSPFQVGGDPRGERSEVRATLSAEPIRLVDFYAPPSAS